MPRRQATFDFVAKCKAASSQTEIGQLLFEEMARCGIDYVACASHVDPLNPPPGAVAIVNYPDDWLTRFSKCDYARDDPIFQAARLATTPFWWGDAMAGRELRPKQKRILSEARECGVVGGFTIPIHSPGALPASCSLVPGAEGFDPLLLPDLQFMAIHAHEEARLRAGSAPRAPVILTERQRECLMLAAQAKSDWAIGKILGISPRTVHHTLETVKRCYGVSHRIQAVMRALLDGELNADEIAARAGADSSVAREEVK